MAEGNEWCTQGNQVRAALGLVAESFPVICTRMMLRPLVQKGLMHDDIWHVKTGDPSVEAIGTFLQRVI